MKNLSNFILESLNKNDYKKISDKIIKQFNIYSVNDKGFVDDYVEYVGNNLINSGEWQDIDEDFDKFVEKILMKLRKMEMILNMISFLILMTTHQKNS